MAPSAGEFFCGLTVAAFDGTLTREAARSSARKALGMAGGRGHGRPRSSPSLFSQGAGAFRTGQIGLLTVMSSCRAKVTIPS